MCNIKVPSLGKQSGVSVTVIKNHRLTEGRRGRFRITPESAKKSLSQMARDLPPVVYFIRDRDGLIKIGHTANLANRKRAFGSGWEHILAVKPGSVDDEKAVHARFAEHLARGEEYFHPVRPLIAYINTLREALGVSPLDRDGCARLPSPRPA